MFESYTHLRDPFFQLTSAAAFVVGFAMCLSTECCTPVRPSELPSECAKRFSDGSSACEPPVMARSLEGKWCASDPHNDICLTINGDSENKSYVWEASDCFEFGALSGGVEFEPMPTAKRTGMPYCFAQVTTELGPDLYSASVDPLQHSGLMFYIDGQHQPLRMSKVQIIEQANVNQ